MRTTCVEDEVEIKMQQYARFNSLLANTKFLTYCNISYYNESKQDIDLLHYFPIDMLINIYCARGLNFNTENFKTSLRELGIETPVVIYKLIYGMTKLRTDAMNFQEKNASCPSNTSTLTKSTSTSLDPYTSEVTGPTTTTEMMLVDQSRFEHEYIQHLTNSYNSSFIDAELSSDDDDI